MYRKLFYISLIFSFLLSNKAICQQNVYAISFKDKNNTPFRLTSPNAYLSARSLTRRSDQSISIDSTDLPVNQVYIDSVLRLTHGIFYETSRWLNVCVILLNFADTGNINNLAGRSFISSVKQVGHYGNILAGRSSNNTRSIQSSSPAAKPTSIDGSYYSQTWIQTQLVNGNFLHDNGFNGSGKLIAVLDAGFIGTNTHPAFDSMWAHGNMIDAYDFTYHNNSVYSHDGHGTEVLSTIAGYIPGTFVGTAPSAMFAIYITENDTDDQPVELYNMVAATERADSVGADVITISLGYDVFWSSTPPNQSYPQPFDSLDGKTTVAAKGADIATKKGILFVASAGNDGTPIAGWGTHILTPGDADSALTIGAVDGTGYPASFSGYGPNAAGVIKPDVCAMGDNATVCNPYLSPLIIPDQGTSFSTPQIAGLAACLWEAFPSATPYQIKQAIIRCASSYSNPGTQLGYGVPDFSCTQRVLNVQLTPPPFTATNWVIADPNPFGADLKLSVSPEHDGNIDFEMTDIAGKKVFSSHLYFYKGYNAPYIISLPELPQGIYLLTAVSSTQQQIIKLMKN